MGNARQVAMPSVRTPRTVLDDLLASGLDLVICGSAVGLASAAAACYYAGPGNRFWRTLHEVGLTPRQLHPAEFRTLSQFGIGLTDLVKAQAGSDSQVSFRSADRERLRARIRYCQPRVLSFNGKRAAQEFLGVKRVTFGLQAAAIGACSLFVAPSTSGAARASWDFTVWQELAALVFARQQPT